ncbi:MAG: 4-hydroxybenzoate octaprenyltransferase [Rhodospirillales bacterium]
MTEKPPRDATDIRPDSWIDRVLPPKFRPYGRLARLDRPIGTWLLLLPCWWGVALAADEATGGWPDPVLLALFAIGSLVMRGAGCTINDIVDREYDAKVARTATRPIASGDISVNQAIVFLVLQLAVGFAVLSQLNLFTIKLAVASLALVAVYPFAKRVTYWPQLVLGLTFNWGALIGWSAVTGSLDTLPVLVYAAGVFWTLGYDTIYAHQDKADDISVGVKSTALKFGDRTRYWLGGFYAITVILLFVAGHLSDMGIGYSVGLAVGAIHLMRQVREVDIDNPAHCLAVFRSNRNFGLIVLLAIVAGRLTA